MLKQLTDFFSEFEFNSTERVTLAIAYENIWDCREARMRVINIISGYENDMKFFSTLEYKEVEAIAALSGVHLHTTELLLLILLSKKLRERLLGLAMSKKNAYLTLCDIKYKMLENERIFNIVGTNKWDWYKKVFTPNIFAIGRLQFEIGTFPEEIYERDGKVIKRGTPILRVHIPMSGDPLDDKLCSASYRDARKYFAKLLGIEDIPFACGSWLLSPLNKTLLNEKSNIVKFASRYEIIKVTEYENNGSIYPWIFDCQTDTPIEKLPRDTSLRRAYAKFIEDGGKLTYAFGIYFTEQQKQKKEKQPITVKE